MPVEFPPGDDPKAVVTRALLLHELVVRGHDRWAVPGGDAAWADHAARGHPLSRLPPRLQSVEAEAPAYLPRFGPAAGGWTVPPPLSPIPSVGVTRPELVAATDADPAGPALAAVRPWVMESGATFEARELTPAAGFTAADEWDGWFRALPVEALTNATVGRLTAAAAFRDCFVAAQNGGAYGPRFLGAASARLRAWETLGWLVGAAPDAPVAAVALAAERCRWYGFDSDWFDHIAGDLGLVCVRPDGRSMAVLAATDAD